MNAEERTYPLPAVGAVLWTGPTPDRYGLAEPRPVGKVLKLTEKSLIVSVGASRFESNRRLPAEQWTRQGFVRDGRYGDTLHPSREAALRWAIAREHAAIDKARERIKRSEELIVEWSSMLGVPA